MKIVWILLNKSGKVKLPWGGFRILTFLRKKTLDVKNVSLFKPRQYIYNAMQVAPCWIWTQSKGRWCRWPAYLSPAASMPLVLRVKVHAKQDYCWIKSLLLQPHSKLCPFTRTSSDISSFIIYLTCVCICFLAYLVVSKFITQRIKRERKREHCNAIMYFYHYEQRRYSAPVLYVSIICCLVCILCAFWRHTKSTTMTFNIYL